MKFGVLTSYSIAFFSIFILVQCSEEISQPFVLSEDLPENVTAIDINNDQSLGIQPIAAQEGYPDGIVALEKIKFKKNTTLNGNASVIGFCEKDDDDEHEDDDGEESDDDCKSEIKIDKDVVISGQSTLKADKIKVEKNAIVLGRLEANKFKIKSGAQAPDQNPLSTVPALPPFLQGTPGTLIVNGNSGTPLVEGSYGQLKLNKNESIELAGGYYAFSEIDADKENVSIFCKTTCIVMVKGEFEIGKRSNILSTSGNPNKFYFYIEGLKEEDGDHEDAEYEYEEVEIGKESNIVANFYFPYSELEVKKNTTVNGILIGKEIEIDKNCVITSFGQTVPIGDRVISSTSIDIQSIEFLQNDGGVFSVTPTVNPVDILTFANNEKIIEFIGPIKLPANNYTGIRLIIGESNTINVDGVQLPIYLAPSSPTDTITLSGAFAFSSGIGRITEITLATDQNNTIIEPLGQIFFLRPVISIDKINIINEVYVSAQDGNDVYNGTPTLSFSTIQKGIDAATVPGEVLVTAENYNEIFTMKDGVSVLGGFTPMFTKTIPLITTKANGFVRVPLSSGLTTNIIDVAFTNLNLSNVTLEDGVVVNIVNNVTYNLDGTLFQQLISSDPLPDAPWDLVNPGTADIDGKVDLVYHGTYSTYTLDAQTIVYDTGQAFVADRISLYLQAFQHNSQSIGEFDRTGDPSPATKSETLKVNLGVTSKLGAYWWAFIPLKPKNTSYLVKYVACRNTHSGFGFNNTNPFFPYDANTDAFFTNPGCPSPPLQPQVCDIEYTCTSLSSSTWADRGGTAGLVRATTVVFNVTQTVVANAGYYHEDNNSANQVVSIPVYVQAGDSLELWYDWDDDWLSNDDLSFRLIHNGSIIFSRTQDNEADGVDRSYPQDAQGVYWTLFSRTRI